MNSTSPGCPTRRKWSYDIERNAAGWYNNELQYYGNARPENSNVEGGMLVITARREDLSALGLPDWGGQRYSSARLITRDKASWTYGFIEVRAKLPCGVGTWPAIWTLSTPPQTRWPDDGEIDIMEHVGFDPGVVHGTVHTGAYNHTRGNHRSATTTMADACTDISSLPGALDRVAHHGGRRRSLLLPVFERQLRQCRVALRQPAVPDPQHRGRRRLGRSAWASTTPSSRCAWKSTTCASTSRCRVRKPGSGSSEEPAAQ